MPVFPSSVPPSPVELLSNLVPDRPGVEDISRRAANAKQYLNPDGSYTAYVTALPVHYQDSKGRWRDIDTAVVASTDPEYDFMNLTNTVKTYFSKDLFKAGGNVKIQKGDAWITMKSAAGLKLKADGIDVLKKPGLLEKLLFRQARKVKGRTDKLSYPAVYSEGDKVIDIDYTLESNRLLEEIVLHEPVGLPEMAQEITLHHAYAKQQGEEIYFYHEKTHECLGAFPAPVMYELGTDDPKTGSRQESDGLHYEIKTRGGLSLEQSRSFTITKVYDREGRDWLLDPARHYPVAVDDTYQATGTYGRAYGLNATYATARSTYTGCSTAMHAGQSKTSTPYGCYRSFLQFDTHWLDDWIIFDSAYMKLSISLDKSINAEFDIYISHYNWPAYCGDAYYDGALNGGAYLWRNTSGIALNTMYNSNGLPTSSWISVTGTTQYALVSSRDRNGNTSTAEEYVQINTPASGAYQPLLVMTYHNPPAPGATTLVSPANTAVDIATSTNLTWNAASYATSYHLQVSTNVNFSPPLLYDVYSIAATSYPVSLSAGTLYYWRVQGFNSPPAQYGNYSDIWSFTTAFAGRSWDGGGATNNWSDAANWSNDTLPTADDTVTFDGTSSKNCTIDNVGTWTTGQLYLNSGYGGIVTAGTSFAVTNFRLQSGTFDAGAATITLTGNFIKTGGTFTANTSTFAFTGASKTITSGGAAFNNLQIGSASSGGTISASDNLDVNGALTSGNFPSATQSLDISNRTVNFAGDVNLTNLDTLTDTLTTYIFDGTTTLTSNFIAWSGYTSFTVGSATSSGSLTLGDNANFDAAIAFNTLGGTTTLNLNGKTLNYSAATLDFTSLDTFISTGSTVIFDGNPVTLTANETYAFNNITINAGANFTTTGNLNVDGTFTNDGIFDYADDTVYFGGSVYCTSTSGLIYFVNNGKFVFDGGGVNQNFSPSSPSPPPSGSSDRVVKNIQIGSASAGATVTFTGSLDLDGSLTVMDGGPTALNITGAVYFSGNVNLTNLDTLNVTGGDIFFDNTNYTSTLTSAGKAWAGFDVFQVGSSTTEGSLILGDDLDVDGPIQMIFNASANNGTTRFNLNGKTVYYSASTLDFRQLEQLDYAGSTIVFDGGANYCTYLGSGYAAASSLGNVQIGTASTGGDLRAATTISIAGNLTFGTAASTSFSGGGIFKGDVDLTNCDSFTASGSIRFDGTAATLTTTSACKTIAGDVTLGYNDKPAVALTLVGSGLDLNGPLNVNNGGYPAALDISNQTVNISGSSVGMSALTALTATGSTVIFDGGAVAQTFIPPTAALSFNNLQLGSATAGAVVTLSTNNLDVNGNFSVLNGAATTFDISNRTVNFAGNVDLTNLDTFTVTGSTAEFDLGVGTQTLNGAGLSFNNLTHSGAGTLQLVTGNLDVNGSLNNSAGILDANGRTINVGVDWSSAGTFTAGTGTVTFDGAGIQTINNANTWYGLAVTGVTRTVKFQSSVAQTIAANGVLTLAADASNTITLAPLTAATAWLLNVNATGVTQSVSRVSVSYSDASGGAEINAWDGTNTNGGNNPNWSFIPLGVWDGGGSTNNWSEAANWGGDTLPTGTNTITFAAASAKNCTIDALGSWSGGNLSINSGYTGIVTAGTGFTAGNFTLAAGTFNGGSATVTVAGNFSKTGGTFTASTSTFVFTGASKTITSGGAAFNNLQIGSASSGASISTSDNLDVNGNFSVTNFAATTFNISNDTVSFAGNADFSNLDTFTQTSATLIFDGTATLTSAGLAVSSAIQIGSATAGGSLTLADNLDMNGALVVYNGGATTFDISSRTVNFASNVDLTNLDTFTATGSTATFDGTTTLTSVAKAFNNLQIGSATAGGSLTLADNLDMNGALSANNGGATTLNITSRTVNFAGDVSLTNLDTFTATGSTVVFDGTTTLTSAAKALNNVQIGSATAGGSLTIFDDQNINGALVVYNGGATTVVFSGRDVNFSGNVDLRDVDTLTLTLAKINFVGTTTLYSPTALAYSGYTTFQIGTTTASGSVTLGSDMNIDGNIEFNNTIGGTLTFDLGTYTLNYGGTSLNLTNCDTFSGASSTIIFDGGGGGSTLITASKVFGNIQVGTASTGASLAVSGAFDINGNVSFGTAASTSFTISTVNFAGNVDLTNLDSFTYSNATITFDGTTTLTSAGKIWSGYTSFTVGSASASGSLTLGDNADFDAAIAFNTVGGTTTLNLNGKTLNYSAATLDFISLDTLTAAGSTVIFDGITALTSNARALNNVQIGSATAGGSLTLADNLDMNGALSANNGGATTLNITSRTVNFAGDVSLTNLDTFTVTGSTAEFDLGAGTQTLNGASKGFNNLTHSGAGTLQLVTSNLDVNGNFINSAGILDTNAINLNVAGNWTGGGSISGSGTITFDGAADQTINSANTWQKLAVTGATRTVKFQSSVAQTIAANGVLTLAADASNTITLAPLTAATAWLLNVNATGVTQSVSRVSVSYSDASGGAEINASDGTNTNGNNNTNWSFTAAAAADTSGGFLHFF